MLKRHRVNFSFERKTWVFLFRFEAKIISVEVKQKTESDLSEKEVKRIPFALFRVEEVFFSETRSPC
jgi:hypothetical protein